MPELTVNRKCYQVLKPEIEFHMMNEIYAALRIWAVLLTLDIFLLQLKKIEIYEPPVGVLLDK